MPRAPSWVAKPGAHPGCIRLPGLCSQVKHYLKCCLFSACGSAIFPCIPAPGPSAVATHAKRMPAAGGGSSWLLAAQLLVLGFFIRSVARRILELAQSLCCLPWFPTAVRTSSFRAASPVLLHEPAWYTVPSCVVVCNRSARL